MCFFVRLSISLSGESFYAKKCSMYTLFINICFSVQLQPGEKHKQLIYVVENQLSLVNIFQYTVQINLKTHSYTELTY